MIKLFPILVGGGGGSSGGFTNGSAAAPSISFSGDTNTGIYLVSGDTLGFAVAGFLAAQINASTLITSGVNLSAGGNFLLQYKDTITAQTTGTTLSGSNTGQIYSNEGAGGAITLTLPTSAAQGTVYTFMVATAANLVIQAPASETIRIGASVSSAAGTATNGAVGSAITLVKLTSNSWYAKAAPNGTWTLA